MLGAIIVNSEQGTQGPRRPASKSEREEQVWGGEQFEMSGIQMGRPSRQAVGLNLYDSNLSQRRCLGYRKHWGVVSI